MYGFSYGMSTDSRLELDRSLVTGLKPDARPCLLPLPTDFLESGFTGPLTTEDLHIFRTVQARIVLLPTSTSDAIQYSIVRHKHFFDVFLDIVPLIDTSSFVWVFPVVNKSKLIHSTIKECLRRSCTFHVNHSYWPWFFLAEAIMSSGTTMLTERSVI
jgi:hypothetical protein